MSTLVARFSVAAVVLLPAIGCSDQSAEQTQTARAGLQGMNGIGASLVLDSQWNEGYCARIIVTNQHPSATTGTWSVELNLGASSAQDPWGGSFSGSTGQVTVNPAGYNAAIAPSQSTQFGFCASRPNQTVQPTLVSVTSDLPPAGGGDVAPACPSARFEVDQATIRRFIKSRSCTCCPRT